MSSGTQAETKIKDYLRTQKITQAFVCLRSGLDPIKLNLSLNGKRRLTLAEYELICGALGVSVDTFLEPKIPAK